jgi:hypothetical protein
MKLRGLDMKKGKHVDVSYKNPFFVYFIDAKSLWSAKPCDGICGHLVVKTQSMDF